MSRIDHLDLMKVPLYFAYKRRSCHEDQYPGTFHAHQGVELLIVHEGRGTVIVDQTSYELRPGLIAIFQPFELHHIQVELSEETPFVRSIVHFEPSRYEGYFDPWPALATFFRYMHKGKISSPVWYENDLAPIDAVLQSLDEQRVEQTMDPELEECSLFLVTFYRALKQLWESTHTEASRSQELRKPHQAERILEWVEQHYKEPLRLTQMSKDLHLSTFHLSHLFTACTGSSISDYLTAKRMQQAVLLLLKSDKSVSMIAEEVGIASSSYFCKMFKHYFGMPPHRYRKQWSEHYRSTV